MVEQVQMSTADLSGGPTLEEEEAALAKAQAPEGEQEGLILGKFKSQEDLTAAYTELEKAHTRARQGLPQEDLTKSTTSAPETIEAKAGEGNEDGEEDETKESIGHDELKIKGKSDAEQATEEAGLDLAEVSSRFWENGEQLDDSDYTALDEAGYPKEIVDQFIAGQQALATQQRQTVFEAAGGEAKYWEMVEWAGDNWEQSEIDAYDEQVNSNDLGNIIAATKGLSARYAQEATIEPQRTLEGGSDGMNATTAYDNWKQVEHDMSKPEYKADPSFRKQVEQRLAVSNI